MSRNPLTILLLSLLLAATQVFAASKTTNEFIKEFTTAIGNKDKTAFQQLWQLVRNGSIFPRAAQHRIDP